jgi:hypothetical protein
VSLSFLAKLLDEFFGEKIDDVIKNKGKSHGDISERFFFLESDFIVFIALDMTKVCCFCSKKTWLGSYY